MPKAVEKIIFQKNTQALVVSDIHLRLPITPELDTIQQSLSSRIKKLSRHKSAVLVLNGDIFELWEDSRQDVGQIIEGFKDLTSAIRQFTRSKGHSVVLTVGNHDEAINSSSRTKSTIKRQWGAKICAAAEINLNGQTIRIEHGHEFDPYNATSDKVGKTHGRSLVQSTVPKLIKNMPVLFSGISDVVDRSELPAYVMSNLVYKLIVPFVFPLSLLMSIYLLYSSGDVRFLWSFCLVWLACWAITLLLDWLLQFVAARKLGGGASYLDRVDQYQKKHKYDILILGHTHQGGVWHRDTRVYANSGCNDIIVKSRYGFLGIYKFTRFIQLSGILIDSSDKKPIKYQERIVSLVK